MKIKNGTKIDIYIYIYIYMIFFRFIHISNFLVQIRRQNVKWVRPNLKISYIFCGTVIIGKTLPRMDRWPHTHTQRYIYMYIYIYLEIQMIEMHTYIHIYIHMIDIYID